MSVLPPFYLDAVVALETLYDDGDGNPEMISLGSGVLLASPIPEDEIEDYVPDAEGGRPHWIYLATNRHVLEDEDEVYAKLNVKGKAKWFKLGLEDEDGNPLWYTFDDFDVAVTYVASEMLRAEEAEYVAIPEDKWLSVEEMLSAEIGEGDEVFVCGFPLGLTGEERKYAIVRGGLIARLDWDLINDTDSFLLDCFVFPGNSGGPVFLKPQPSISEDGKSLQVYPPEFIGIVEGYLPYEDTAYSGQTGRPRVTFEDNSGLATVVPVDAIAAAIEGCRQSAYDADDPGDDKPPLERRAAKLQPSG